MGFIYNPTKEEQTTKAFGNYFTLKPGQIKQVSDSIAFFIATEKPESGIVELPEAFESLEYRESEEGKRVLAELGASGVKKYVDFHRAIVANNQVSMRRDLEQANIQADPSMFASDGEIESMRIVARYARDEKDATQRRADEVRELTKKIGE